MKKLLLLAIILLGSLSARAQNSRSDGIVFSRNGFPAPGAQIAVCSQTAITAASEVLSTVTITSTLNPPQGSSVQITGVSPVQYNGTYTVLTTSGTNFTYTNPTSGLGAGTVFGTAIVASTPCAPLAALCANATDTACVSPNPVTGDGLGNYSFYVKPGRYTVQFFGSGLTARIQPDQILACDPTNCTLSGGTINGNLTVTGALSAATFDNSCNANLAAGADLGAKINTCLALGNNTDIMITAGGTISTQVVINNLTNVRIRGQGAWGTNINNGITGAGAICAMKITGTSSAIILDNFQILGNTLTGASGNGNGICIYGTGANPSNIYFTNMSVQGNKGTGLDGTSTSMPAAGVYVYKAIDISFVGGGYGGNQLGMVFDNSVNNVQVEKQGIFGNTTGGIKVINTGGSIEIGPNNDIEGNGALTTDFWFLMDSCEGCSMHNNFVQSNSGEMLIKDTFTPTQFNLYGNILIHGGSGSSPNLSWMLDSTANVNLDIHNNWINMQQSMTNLIDITPSTNATVYKRIANNNFNFTAGGAVSNHGINWQAGSHVGPCIIEGNAFGDSTLTTFTGGSAIATGATTSGCRVMNNGCATASGTLTNCVQVEAGATNTLVSGTSKSGAGTVTNLVNDGGTNTICQGTGCPAPLSTTGIFQASGNKVTLTADWTCGTTGTVASCVAAQIIGSGGGVPMTFTLPLVAASYKLDCDFVVGQAGAATSNQWNLLTATNGATNVTANYIMGTAATAMAVGAVTDQASTTTTFQIAPNWTLGGTGTKMPVHIHADIEGAAAAGTVLSVQLVAPTVGDLVTIFRGGSCHLY